MILFQNSTKQFKFHTQAYINIAIFYLFSMCEFFNITDHMYIKFYNLCMHKTSYTFILFFTYLFITV